MIRVLLFFWAISSTVKAFNWHIPTPAPSSTPTNVQPTFNATTSPSAINTTFQPTIKPTTTPSTVTDTIQPISWATIAPSAITITLQPKFNATLAPSVTKTVQPTFWATTPPSMITGTFQPTFSSTTAPSTVATTAQPTLNATASSTAIAGSITAAIFIVIPRDLSITGIISLEGLIQYTLSNTTGIPIDDINVNHQNRTTLSPVKEFNRFYDNPSVQPTIRPVVYRSFAPSSSPPSTGLSAAPSKAPSDSAPTGKPSIASSPSPLLPPSSKFPSMMPTMDSSAPTVGPSLRLFPTDTPTESPTNIPTGIPTYSPTEIPTDNPTDSPTDSPTDIPTDIPTYSPTSDVMPSFGPTLQSTASPSIKSASLPTQAPYGFQPSNMPNVPITRSPTGFGTTGSPTGAEIFVKMPFDMAIQASDNGRRRLLTVGDLTILVEGALKDGSFSKVLADQVLTTPANSNGDSSLNNPTTVVSIKAINGANIVVFIPPTYQPTGAPTGAVVSMSTVQPKSTGRAVLFSLLILLLIPLGMIGVVVYRRRHKEKLPGIDSRDLPNHDDCEKKENNPMNCSPVPQKSYDILGLPLSANIAEVKKKYRKLSLKYHPDKNKSIEAPKKFADVTEAYRTILHYKEAIMNDRTTQQA